MCTARFISGVYLYTAPSTLGKKQCLFQQNPLGSKSVRLWLGIRNGCLAEALRSCSNACRRRASSWCSFMMALLRRSKYWIYSVAFVKTVPCGMSVVELCRVECTITDLAHFGRSL